MRLKPLLLILILFIIPGMCKPAHATAWVYDPPVFDLGILFSEVNIRVRYPPTLNYSLKPVFDTEAESEIRTDHQEIAGPMQMIFRAWGEGKRYTARFTILYPNVVNDTILVTVQSGNFSQQVMRLPVTAKQIHLQFAFTCVKEPSYPSALEVAQAEYSLDQQWRRNQTVWMEGMDGWRVLISAVVTGNLMLAVVTLALVKRNRRKSKGIIGLEET